ncbi:MAG: alpha-glucosidase [Actinobacteria bacterium 13_2_20CM_2_72_6]|nr:MAG: alpha-glucosidase [Actinobacteria bacterium 13_2_20CM_2_72_6]
MRHTWRRWTGLAASGMVLALLAPTAPAQADPARQWHLTPPGVRPAAAAGVAADLALTRTGGLTLSVRHGGTTVVQPSALGIVTADADFTTGLRLDGFEQRQVHEEYQTLSGKRHAHVADAAQTTLHLSRGGKHMDLVVRVAADGVAYRYVLPGNGWHTVTGEASEYAIAGSADSFLLPFDNGRSDYESIHNHSTVDGAAPAEYGYPALFHVGDSWLLVTESDLDRSYGGSRLTLDATSRRFTVTLPDPAEVWKGELGTPWRTTVVGDLATVTESDLVTDLAEPSKVADTSWIKPGTGAWSWWADGSTTGNLAAQEAYADFASRMGWPYILVDSGWNAAWMPELVQYAAARNVHVWIWVRWQTLDQPSEIDRLLPQYKSWGVVGLKIDFPESDGQDRMRWYNQIEEGTAKYQLMLNFHGCTIPRGTERTWPQVVGFEAVRGGEGTRPNPTRVPYPTSHYTTLPFTRNAVGPMDFTPVTFSGVRLNSDAAELALGIIYENGIQHFSDSPASYDAHPLAERLLKDVPSTWDDTKLLDGLPGDRVVLARQHGNDWFVGAMVSGPARTLSIPLSFLGGGAWTAELYHDGVDNRTMVLDTSTVTAGGTLSVPVLQDGGFALRLHSAT